MEDYVEISGEEFNEIMEGISHELEQLRAENEALKKEARLAKAELEAVKHSIIFELKGLVGNSHVREGGGLTPLSGLNYLNRIRHLVKIEKVMLDTMVQGCNCGSKSVAGSHHKHECPVRKRFEAIHGQRVVNTRLTTDQESQVTKETETNDN